MHIPDGFLSIGVSAMMYVMVFLFWILAFGRAKKVVGEKHIPFLAVIAAAIFGGQMLNFTLIGVGGTSGHLLGAALAAMLLGPYGAIIVMTLVLVVQALFFADGGVVVLGANVFNMGVVGAFVGYIIYGVMKKIVKNISVPVFLASWGSVVFASLFCAIELGLSGTISMSNAILAMVPIHAVIGVGEGIITVGVMMFIKKTRPDLLKIDKISPRGWMR